MSLNSINTNVGAQIALQTLNSTNSQLQDAQNQVSTGLRVSSAKDDGAIWSIAQAQRSQVTALTAVTDSLNRASSVLDVAVTAGQTVSDLLNQLKAKALEATDTSLSTSDRTAISNDFKSLVTQVKTTIANASFDGGNLIKSGAVALNALSGPSGKQTITLAAQAITFGTSGTITFTSGATLSTATVAQGLVSALNISINNVNSKVSALGTEANQVSGQLTFVSNLSDSLTSGIGNLVDADVAAESATLQALQTKQQLGIQALSIANSSSSNLLSLFRG
jgi:flagellin